MLLSLVHLLSQGRPCRTRTLRGHSLGLMLIAAIIPFLLATMPYFTPFGIPVEAAFAIAGIIFLFGVVTIPLAFIAW